MEPTTKHRSRANKLFLLCPLTFQLASVNKASSNDKSAPGDITASQLTKPSAVLFDKGKVIDAATGRVIQFQQRMPTLKVNIREKKREQLKIEKPSEDIKESKHFDPRMR